VMFPREDNDYCGFGLSRLSECFAPVMSVADILVEVEQTLRVVAGSEAVERLREIWREYANSDRSRSLEAFEESLPWLIEELRRIPRSKDPKSCPRVLVTGDFFTRFSPFFMEGVPERYAEHGIILKPADFSDLVLYAVYDAMSGMARNWGLEPGYGALAKGCLGILRPDGREYLQQWKGYRMLRWEEERYRREFQKTGLLVSEAADVSRLLREAKQHVSPALYGEVIPTVGLGLDAGREGYDGIFLIGPFNCLALRISEAILKPVCLKLEMPILTYESDGYAAPPVFLRQVEVHIQQVLDGWRRRHGAESDPSGRSSNVLSGWLTHRRDPQTQPFTVEDGDSCRLETDAR
jgi:hypothetical protein